MNPLRVAVIGVGHLGARHAETYAKLPGVRLAVVCDRAPARAAAIAKTLRCRAVTDARQVIGLADAASLAVPTSVHAAVGLPLLQAGIHLLVEKPIAAVRSEAQALIRAARQHRCVLQVGHIERFNAAIREALRHLRHPRFIEVHRLSPYPFRGTDVSVILDVMIHDLDLLLNLVGSQPSRVEAVGVSVLSPGEDIANARLVFASGCVANLTASRISDESIRRFRVFQEDCYLSVDSKAQTVELARLTGRTIRRVELPVNRRPPLQEELAAFVHAVTRRRPPAVSGEDGLEALRLALRIERAMRRCPAPHAIPLRRRR